ncbi:MAG: hypothetical protein AB1728_13985 [Bacteroidota bacterium]
MHSHHEQLTITLLRDDPKKFLRYCQPIIEICVHQYMASGMFPYAEAKDIIQSVNEKLYARLGTIDQHYTGRVLLRTYINATVRNICLRIHEERNHSIKTIQIHEEHGIYTIDPTNAFVFDEELERLHTVLQLFHEERNKLYIAMKLYLKIPLRKMDIYRWNRHLAPAQKEFLISLFGKNYDEMTIHEIFAAFAPVWNSVERTSSAPKSIERWTNEQINVVIKLMNGNPPRRSHSKETLQVLLSEEYSRHLNKES